MFWQKFVSLCEDKGVSPTAAGAAIGVTSASVANWKKGGVPRRSAIKALSDYFNVPISFFSESDPDQATILPDNSVVLIPVYESVSAGLGAFASNYVVDYLPVSFSRKSEADEVLCVKVRGDSMYPTICDGDTVLVHRQETAENGQIAVVMIDGEDAVVKRFHASESFIELQSVNPMYPPRRFRGDETQKIRVCGVVRKVIKDL